MTHQSAEVMMTGRWLAFVLVSLALAGALIALTWQRGQPWSAQPLLVPAWIALSPFFLFPLFKQAPKHTAQERWRKLRVLLLGTGAVQVLNVALVLTNVIDWHTAIPVLLFCGVTQVGGIAIVLLARERRA